LAALVGVVDHAWARCAGEHGHLEGLDHQFGPHVVGHGPAHDPSAVGVDHDGQIEPALPGAVLGDVSDPQSVRPVRGEVTLDKVRRGCGLGVPDGQATPPPSVYALDGG
jgi:hypothetical protein